MVLGFGTGTVNFFGRYAYVGEGKSGLDAVVWTEQDEPQAVIGSHLQKLAYPANYAQHVQTNKGELKDAHHHCAREILDLQLRGEYLYTANGADGFEVFDVANIDQKGFSERIVTAPSFCRWASAPGCGPNMRPPSRCSSTLAVDPLRLRRTNNITPDPQIWGDLRQQ